MLFLDTQGKLVDIRKMNYMNDTEYYYAIMKTKGFIPNSSKHNELNKIISLIKK